MSTGWSELGPDFLSVGDWSVGQGPDAPDRQLVRKLVEAWECPDILEVGFGPGIDSPALAELGVYTGYDVTPELVDRARNLLPGVFYVRDVLGMDDEKAFDVVYARHVLEHVTDGERALQRLLSASRGIVVLSWFIRPTFTPSEVGCVIGDGFPHWTYDALRWMELVEAAGFHLYRWDFDHDRTRCSVWMMSREPQPELAQVAHDFFGSAAFRSSVLPVPEPVNEPYEAALNILDTAYDSFNQIIPVVERIPDLIYVCRDSLSALTVAEEFVFPTQDEDGARDVIRQVRDAKARVTAVFRSAEVEAAQAVAVQGVRDAHRIVETCLREAGRL